MRLITCLVALALIPATASADGSVKAASSPFNERLTERVPVGGRSLVGVVATPTSELPDGMGLISGRLTLPGSLTGAVCVRARTQDGRYEAENTFVPTETAGTLHTLDWSAAFDALQRVKLREVAALTTIGACGTASSIIVPTGMDGAATADGKFLQILVNTRGASTWAVLRDPAVPGPALARSHCTRLEDGARVAYDARCLLGPLPTNDHLELRLEQEGRDGLSLEVVAKMSVRTGDALP